MWHIAHSLMENIYEMPTMPSKHWVLQLFIREKEMNKTSGDRQDRTIAGSETDPTVENLARGKGGSRRRKREEKGHELGQAVWKCLSKEVTLVLGSCHQETRYL